MAEYTPGPWTWTYRNDRLETADGAVIILDCNEHGYDGMFGGEPPNEADARLIAAAPELLEALEDIFAGNSGAHRRARAVIGKARGES